MGRVCLHVGIMCPAYMIRPKGGSGHDWVLRKPCSFALKPRRSRLDGAYFAGQPIILTQVGSVMEVALRGQPCPAPRQF